MSALKTRPHAAPKYTWEIARFFPEQGNWTEEDYFELEDRFGGGIRVEFDDGRLEFLPLPTQSHQRVILYLLGLLQAFTAVHAPGEILFSGMRIRLRARRRTQFREPDVVYMRKSHRERCHEKFWDGADLVMEVVSGSAGDRRRDLVDKALIYAAAGIPEYWIIDLKKASIRVLTLNGKRYRVHGDFRAGEHADSVLLSGFRVAVDDVLASARA